MQPVLSATWPKIQEPAQAKGLLLHLVQEPLQIISFNFARELGSCALLQLRPTLANARTTFEQAKAMHNHRIVEARWIKTMKEVSPTCIFAGLH